ncbi:MAG: class I SAM-dependent methyltransferase [Pseudomonadota bacterium]
MPSLGDAYEFECFLGQFRANHIVDEIVKNTDKSADATREQFDVYLNEAKLGFSFLQRHLCDDKANRILEIGAGLRIVSMYLSNRGYDVTALEPIGKGFSFFDVAGDVLWEATNAPRPHRINEPANVLRREEHGEFDFIFSIHVLEHIDNLDDAIEALCAVMSPSGKMVHLCPNYAFPYEPHFGIPLIPWMPRLSRKLLISDREIDDELWNSLNFITARKIKRMLSRRGFDPKFVPGVMSQFIHRYKDDELFAKRHNNSVMHSLINLTTLLHLEKLIDLLPAEFLTPMEFSATRIKAEASCANTNAPN